MKNMSLTFCTPQTSRLNLKHPGMIPEYKGMPLALAEECIVRISISDIENISSCKRQIDQKLPGHVDFQGSILVFMDISNQNVLSWKNFRTVWHQFIKVATSRYKRLKGFGLSGSALLLPAGKEGHLSAEFLNALMPESSDIKEKWVGVPLTPLFADYYRSYSSYIKSIAYQPFDAFHSLGFRIQGELPAKNEKLSLLFSNKLLPDLPGNTLQDKYCEFINLIPGIDRIRLTDLAYVDPRLYDSYKIKKNKLKGEKCKDGQPPPDKNILTYPPLRRVKKFIREGYESGIFNEIEIIELLLLVTGCKKAMRTSVERNRFAEAVKFFTEKGVHWKSVKDSVQQIKDKGKGGWSNLFHPTRKCKKNKECYTIYIGLTDGAVQNSYMCEDDNNSFGEIMSYPECCRVAYERNLLISSKKQGDLVPIVAEQTIERPPWSFLLNAGARYFEKALISFSPCSYTCVNAKQFALEAFGQVKKYLPAYASVLRKYLSSSVLYTEYLGVYLFLDSRIDGSTLHYEPSKIQMTTFNNIGRTLLQGNILRVSDYDEVQIRKGNDVLKTLKGDNVKMLFFNSDF